MNTLLFAPSLLAILLLPLVTSVANGAVSRKSKYPCELLLSGSTRDELGALTNVGRQFPSADGHWLTLTDLWSDTDLMIDENQIGPKRPRWVALNLLKGQSIPLQIEIPTRDGTDGTPLRTEDQIIYFKDRILANLHSDYYDALYVLDLHGKRINEPVIQLRQKNQKPVWPSITNFQDQNRILVRNTNGYDIFDLDGVHVGKLGPEPYGHWKPLGPQHFFAASADELTFVNLSGETVRILKAADVDMRSFLKSSFKAIFGEQEIIDSPKKFTFDLMTPLVSRHSLLIGMEVQTGGPYWAVEIPIHGNPNIVMTSEAYSDVKNKYFHVILDENHLVNTKLKKLGAKDSWSTEIQIRDLGEERIGPPISVLLDGQWMVINVSNNQIVAIDPTLADEPTKIRVFDLKGRVLYQNDHLSNDAWRLSLSNSFIRLDHNRFLLQGQNKLRPYEIDVEAKELRIREEHIVAYSEKFQRLFVTVPRTNAQNQPTTGIRYQVIDFDGHVLKDFGRKSFGVSTEARNVRFLSSNSLLIREHDPKKSESGKLRYLYWE